MLLSALFSTPAMDHALSDETRQLDLLRFEAALARAEATLGVIPADAMSAIQGACGAAFPESELAKGISDSGNIAIPLVGALTRRVAATDANAARYVHWGATSQDALDTALVLFVRRAMSALDRDGLESTLATMAHEQRSAVLAGRTWLQQAVPTTLGLKAAGWLDAASRAGRRVEQAARGLEVVQLGGAAGTLASLGEKGPAVIHALAQELGLEAADLPWHTARDRVVDLGCALGVYIGVLGKIARDVSLLLQSEIGELTLGAGGGSSAMPQKKNPVGCAVALAAATRAPGLVATLLSAMTQEHERGLGNWLAEWETLPELFRMTAGALARMTETLHDVTPDLAAMRANLGPLVMAEAVSVALAESLGKAEAHALVQQATRAPDFAAALRAEPRVKAALAERLEALLAPENYLGSNDAFIDAVLQRREQR